MPFCTEAQPWCLGLLCLYSTIPIQISLVMTMMIICFCGMVNQRQAFDLFSSPDHCQDPDHCEYLTRQKQDLNLCRILAQAYSNECSAVLITTTPRHHTNSCKNSSEQLSGFQLLRTVACQFQLNHLIQYCQKILEGLHHLEKHQQCCHGTFGTFNFQILPFFKTQRPYLYMENLSNEIY